MELRQPKAVRRLDQNDSGVRHVDPHFHDGGGYEDLELAVAEGAHRRVLLRRRHAAVQQPKAQVRKDVAREALVFLHGSLRLNRLGLFD